MNKKLTELVEMCDGEILETFTVYETDELDKFKSFEFNRKDFERRARKIMRNMERRSTDGLPKWVSGSVIVCDENYCVADGEGRLQAAKGQQNTAQFMVVPNLTYRDIQDFNTENETWKTYDYIYNKGGRGIGDYAKLYQLVTTYRFRISPEIIAGVLMNNVSIPKPGMVRVIKYDLFKVSENITERQVTYILKEVDEIYQLMVKSGLKVGKRKDVLQECLIYVVLLSMKKTKEINLGSFKRNIQNVSEALKNISSLVATKYTFLDLCSSIANQYKRKHLQVELRESYPLDFVERGFNTHISDFIK